MSREIEIPLAEGKGRVSGLLEQPADAGWLLVLGHGAGAGMRHSFMADLTDALARVGIATLRYQFPYMERGQRFPGPERERLAAVSAAVEAAAALGTGLPLLAGGKSMGARMTSGQVAAAGLPGVRGLAFFGFPLHPAGRPGTQRAVHLEQVDLPMLFLQGDRDKLADLELLRPVCEGLGERADLRLIAGADHGFHVLKRSGRTDQEVLTELAEQTRDWAMGIAPSGGPAGP